jgi:DNA-binding transcriptional LysR family regulator
MDRLAAIEIFIRVVDTGSFSAVARHYDVGQPAVSKAIAQLEEWLGVKLLLRSTRALTPTEACTTFYQHARRAVEETDEAVLAVRGTASGLSGKLRVSAAVCFARLHIVPRLPEFLEQHPNLDLELVQDDRNIDLVEEGIDLALRMGVPADSNITARRIAEARRRVVGTPEYFRRHGIPAEPADLLAHRAVILVMDDWMLPPINLSAIYPTGRLAGTKARQFTAMEHCLTSESDPAPEACPEPLQPAV